jgi:hypothetical protein
MRLGLANTVAKAPDTNTEAIPCGNNFASPKTVPPQAGLHRYTGEGTDEMSPRPSRT